MNIDGTGQTIAIAGQSELEANFADIRAFQKKFNLPPNLPQVVPVGPSPGVTSAVTEADLDIEWSSAIARGAQITYVQSSNSVTSAVYAVDQNLAPVISYSFGGCEQVLMYMGVLFRSIVQQANAQGITFRAASGDSGAATRDGAFSEPVATNGLGVSFPASIPEVTAVGGSEFNEGSGAYWSSTNTPNPVVHSGESLERFGGHRLDRGWRRRRQYSLFEARLAERPRRSQRQCTRRSRPCPQPPVITMATTFARWEHAGFRVGRPFRRRFSRAF
jgi:subtilase family serine protease